VAVVSLYVRGIHREEEDEASVVSTCVRGIYREEEDHPRIIPTINCTCTTRNPKHENPKLAHQNASTPP
jgi:hypothetical protein